MTNNYLNQKTKNGKISSLGLGFIVLSLIFLGIIVFGILSYLTSYMIVDLKFGSHLGFFGSLVYYMVMSALSIVGMGRGLAERKSHKINTAAKGIALGFINLLLAITIGFLTTLSFIALGV